MSTLTLVRLGIETHQETVVFVRRDCALCRAEGFDALSQVEVNCGDKSIIARLVQVTTDILAHNEASLSEVAFRRLAAKTGDKVIIRHARPLESLGYVRAKIYGQKLDATAIGAIIKDVAAGRYSDIHISAFLTACAVGDALDRDEMIALTAAMADVGERVTWDQPMVLDKHCIGGLPANRTTPIVVAIVAAAGLTIPKTSSRAITSPAGTADTMETLAPVELDLASMRRVVDQEGGCIIWGQGVEFSPVDDIFIRVERLLDLDSEGQLVASILSKKVAAGGTHLLLDIPVGPTVKVRSREQAERLKGHLMAVATAFGIKTHVLFTDGRQPVGAGIGPALEARDVLRVLQGAADASITLRERSLMLAGELLEMAHHVPKGGGVIKAMHILDSGAAWKKFQRICEAQGGLRVPPIAAHQMTVNAPRAGRLQWLDNRLLARVAKLAGAPSAPAAGVELHVSLEDQVILDQPLFTIHAETPGELAYAREYARHQRIFHFDGDGMGSEREAR